MRSLISTFLLAVLVATGCGRSGSPPTNSDQKILVVNDVSTNTGVVLARTDISSSSDPASDYNSVHVGEKAHATFSEGDGSSIKDAVVVTADSEATGNRAAYIWLHSVIL